MANHSPASRTLLRRILPILPLLLIAAALGGAMLLSSADPLDDLADRALPRSVAIASSASPIFDAPSTEAQQHAVDFLGSIDKAVANGVEVLRGGDSKSIIAQGRYFNALVNAGYAQFGSSDYDPLGSCGAAGSSARHLWHTQVRALQEGARNALSGELRKASDTLERDRRSCLADVSQALTGKPGWLPGELASLGLAPAVSPFAAWPESPAESPSTNL
jgi:hypothetical protein